MTAASAAQSARRRALRADGRGGGRSARSRTRPRRAPPAANARKARSGGAAVRVRRCSGPRGAPMSLRPARCGAALRQMRDRSGVLGISTTGGPGPNTTQRMAPSGKRLRATASRRSSLSFHGVAGGGARGIARAGRGNFEHRACGPMAGSIAPIRSKECRLIWSIATVSATRACHLSGLAAAQALTRPLKGPRLPSVT